MHWDKYDFYYTASPICNFRVLQSEVIAKAFLRCFLRLSPRRDQKYFPKRLCSLDFDMVYDCSI